MILVENKAAPLRFLLVVTIGWVTLRGIMLSGWAPGEAPQLRWAPGPGWLAGALRPWHMGAAPRAAAVARTVRAILAPADRRVAAVGATAASSPEPGDAPSGRAAGLDPVTMRYLSLVGYDRPNHTFYARATAEHEADAVTGAGATPAAGIGSRWSGSAWAFVRGGGHTTPLAPVGQIGGGQAGARILYRLTDRLAAAGRISRTIGGPDQTEAALGVDWRPVARLPLHLMVERRIAIDHGGRDAFAAGAAGGVYALPIARGWRLDGYAEAGIVGARRRDLYADGAVRAGRALDLGDGRSLTIGLGAWGAAQPRAERLDAGPSAVLRLPIDRRTIAVALDYRGRLLGDARPHSGVALTAGVDF